MIKRKSIYFTPKRVMRSGRCCDSWTDATTVTPVKAILCERECVSQRLLFEITFQPYCTVPYRCARCLEDEQGKERHE